MSDSSSSIIRTTVWYHETNEPSRQKPVIRIDGTTTTHYIDAVDLANTVRASIDSGRDNPFKPDGEIYRSADPIVDFYKFGPNQMRGQTPVYKKFLMTNGKMAKPNGQLKLNGTDKKETKRLAKLERDLRRKREKEIKEIQKRLEKKNHLIEESDSGTSCWRRWFNCCCFGCRCLKCCSKRKRTTAMETEQKNSSNSNNNEHQRLRNNIEFVTDLRGGQALATNNLVDLNKKTTDKTSFPEIASKQSEPFDNHSSLVNSTQPSIRRDNSKSELKTFDTTLNLINPLEEQDKMSTPSLNIEFVPVASNETDTTRGGGDRGQ